MDLSFLHRDYNINSLLVVRGFQSLFLWIFRSYILSRFCTPIGTKFVSILVLMDLSFLHEIKEPKKAPNKPVSILVLMDLSFLQDETMGIRLDGG